MPNKQPIKRRRFIKIIAAATGLAVSQPIAAMARTPIYRWRGIVLGALAEIQIAHEDVPVAKKVVHDSVNEIKRLEKIFSLYQKNSAVVELNKSGSLKEPPLDLVRLIQEASYYYEITGGNFDITVQPLWDLYAKHYSSSQASVGPNQTQIELAHSLVGMGKIKTNSEQITLPKSGMSLTFNGIAQGYVTDRVAELMKFSGIENVLVDLGEASAIGSHPDGRPWVAGIEHSDQTIELNDMALATSSAEGTPFGELNGDNHLFNPKSGRCANRYKSVSVISAQATAADALSTAFSFMSVPDISLCLKRIGHSKAIIVNNDGTSFTI